MEDTFELLVYADDISNLELLRKGLYRLEFHVECHGIKAVPIGSLVAPSRLTSCSRGVECAGSDEGTEPGYLDDINSSYITRAVYCRYVDESFHLGEAAQFVLKLPRSAWYTTKPADVMLTVNLLRAEFGLPPPPVSGKGETVAGKVETVLGAAGHVGNRRLGAFEKVSSRTLTAPLVNVLKDGTPQLRSLDLYSAVVFDSMNLCVSGLSFHGCLVSSAFSPLLAPKLPPSARQPSHATGDLYVHTSESSDSQSTGKTPPAAKSSGLRGWLTSLTKPSSTVEDSSSAVLPTPTISFAELLFPSFLSYRMPALSTPATSSETAAQAEYEGVPAAEADAAHCRLLTPLLLALVELDVRIAGIVSNGDGKVWSAADGDKQTRFSYDLRRRAAQLASARGNYAQQQRDSTHGKNTTQACADPLLMNPAKLYEPIGKMRYDRSGTAALVDGPLSPLGDVQDAYAHVLASTNAPFSSRVAPALHVPDSVVCALESEVKEVVEHLALRWRSFHKILAHSFGRATETLRALYRAALMTDIQGVIAHRLYPPECLTDADAAAPWRIARCPRRHTLTLPDLPIALRPIAALECFPMTTGIEKFQSTLAITEFTYSKAPVLRHPPAPLADFSDKDDDEEDLDDAGADADDAIRHESDSGPVRLRRYSGVPSEDALSPPTSGTPQVPSSHRTSIAEAASDDRLAGEAHVPFGPWADIIPASPAAPAGSAHVVIFLNGLGGNMHDTRVLRSYLKLYHPDILCLVTTSNQNKATEGDIIEAGARMAREIHEMLAFKVADEGLVLHKWSIVAFSLGGVVARLALRHPLLQSFLPRAHAFVSVASPHLGVLYSQSAMVSAGMYLFRAWRNSQSLSQLSYTDEDTTGEIGLRKCFLYLLACGWEVRAGDDRSPTAPHDEGVPASLQLYETEHLNVKDSPSTPPGRPSFSSEDSGDFGQLETAASPVASITQHTNTVRRLVQQGFDNRPNGFYMKNFHHIVLLSSEQDSYAPWHSCGVLWCDAALADSKHGGAYGEMLRGFFDNVGPQSVRRWDVHYKNLSSIFAGRITLDAVLGREAHVAFLENDHVALSLCLGLQEIWDTDMYSDDG